MFKASKRWATNCGINAPRHQHALHVESTQAAAPLLSQHNRMGESRSPIPSIPPSSQQTPRVHARNPHGSQTCAHTHAPPTQTTSAGPSRRVATRMRIVGMTTSPQARGRRGTTPKTSHSRLYDLRDILAATRWPYCSLSAAALCMSVSVVFARAFFVRSTSSFRGPSFGMYLRREKRLGQTRGEQGYCMGVVCGRVGMVVGTHSRKAIKVGLLLVVEHGRVGHRVGRLLHRERLVEVLCVALV